LINKYNGDDDVMTYGKPGQKAVQALNSWTNDNWWNRNFCSPDRQDRNWSTNHSAHHSESVNFEAHLRAEESIDNEKTCL